ncbi:MAG: Na(+)/H(+) antiporter subunit B [Rhodospirillaceae bacterium]|nr:Na(+)/H(+) antiporter subunit B [Rhodospirillaceae bacterium]
MMHQKSVLRVVSKLLIPPILLFALYVQFHGDFGPGGGFQAGVIFATAFILYGLIFGVATARRVIPAAATRTMLSLGLLLYGGTGIWSLLLGGEFLDYNLLASTPSAGQHLGILLVEFGVGMTVAGAMTTIFYTFAAQTLGGDDTPKEEV